jgi:hypothetical protein
LELRITLSGGNHALVLENNFRQKNKEIGLNEPGRLTNFPHQNPLLNTAERELKFEL